MQAALADMEVYKQRMREERSAESDFAKQARLDADLQAFTDALIAREGRVYMAADECELAVSTIYRRAKRMQEWQDVLDRYSIKTSRKL